MGYLWFRTWHDSDNRLWAERFLSGDPSEAKQHHADDCTFRWTNTQQHNPSVTDLTFHNETGSIVTVKTGRERDETTGTPTPTPAQLANTLTPPQPTTPTDTESLPF